MPNLHPLLVHFPLAILALGFLLDLVALLFKEEELHQAGWWSQLAGTVGLAAAVISGLIAKGSVKFATPAATAIESHEQIALIVAAVFTILLLWRMANQTRVPNRLRMLFLALLGLGVALMWVGAFYGGELVYRFGVGVR